MIETWWEVTVLEIMIIAAADCDYGSALRSNKYCTKASMIAKDPLSKVVCELLKNSFLPLLSLPVGSHLPLLQQLDV